MMSPEEYQNAAIRTMSDDAPLINAALGICGEAEEFCRSSTVDELGDLCWYCAVLLYVLGRPFTLPRERNRIHSHHEWSQAPRLLLAASCKIAEHAKKWRFHEKNLDRDLIVALVERVLWHASVISLATLEEAMDHNIKKLQLRYPDGFDASRK